MFSFAEIIRPKPLSDTNSLPSTSAPSEVPHPAYDTSLRGRIFHTLENPSYSYLSTGLAWTQLVIVLSSVVTFMIGTLPQYWASTPRWLTILEWIFGVYFTVDYLMRFFTARVWYRWIYQPFNIIDLISTAPFWIDLILKGIVKRLAVLRVLRLLRVFRVIRAAKAAVYVKILINTLKQSRDALLLLLFVIAILVSLFASVLFFAEQTGQKFNKTEDQWYRFDGSVSPFQSIFHCLWWAIVTITTTGYGDTFPVTLAGKIVGGLCMLAGVTMIAFPIAVLGNNFSQAWNEFQTKKAQKRALRKVQKGKSSKANSVDGDRPSIEFEMNRMGSTSNQPLVVDISAGADAAPPPTTAAADTSDPNVTFKALHDREVREALKKLKQLLNTNDAL